MRAPNLIGGMPWREKERAERIEVREATRREGEETRAERTRRTQRKDIREGDCEAYGKKNSKEPAKELSQEGRTNHAERPHTETTKRL